MEIITANINKYHNGKYRVTLYILGPDGYNMAEAEDFTFEEAVGYVILIKEKIEKQ